MEYVYLIGRLIAHPAVTNILLLVIMLSVWRVQDIITEVTTDDMSLDAMGKAIKVQDENYRTGN